MRITPGDTFAWPILQAAGAATVLFSALFTIPTFAGVARTGNDLLEECTSKYPEMKQFCFGYIIGISDVLNANSVNGFRSCIPSFNTTLDQVAGIAVKYLKEHPERRSYAASGIIANALYDAFPCSLDK